MTNFLQILQLQIFPTSVELVFIVKPYESDEK